MAETEELPEEIILNIFSRLPVKSLIRFTSVSKRLHFIILSDPKFAQSQLKAAPRISRRLLVSTDAPLLESPPLSGDPSSSRKLTLPFRQQPGHHVMFLGSCNGLVFLTCPQQMFYVWNPSLGFLKQLPDPGFSSNKYFLCLCGAAYLSSADDYRVLLTSRHRTDDHEWKFEAEMFSMRTHIWKRIERPGSADVLLSTLPVAGVGILLNDALHWLDYNDYELLCFGLAEELFRTMPLPDFGLDWKSFSHLGVYGGCICVSRYPSRVWGSIDFWVMREYEVSDSWTRLFRLELPHGPNMPLRPREVLVLDSIVAMTSTGGKGIELIRIDYKENNKLWYYKPEGNWCSMIEYEESLLWISGYDPVKKRTTQNPTGD